MKLIKKSRLEEFIARHPQSKAFLLDWFRIIKKSHWRSFHEMRLTLPTVDMVKVRSGRKASIFNINQNEFRLITAVHFEKNVKDEANVDKVVEGKIFLLFFLTHAEYDKNLWKERL